MKSKAIGVILAAVLAGCAAAPRSSDIEAQQACDRLVRALSAENLLAASKNWPVRSGVANKPDFAHHFASGVPQDYLPPLGGDLPHFWVSGYIESSEFWIRKSEGPAGMSTWYGPLVLDDAGHPVAASSGH